MRKRYILGGGEILRRAFTLVELLVVISVIAILMAILGPVVNLARRKALQVVGTANQRSIVQAANMYAGDNDWRYLESVGTVGSGDGWSWQEPMKLVGYNTRSPRLNRSMNTYLRSYIDKAEVVYCPSAPYRFKYLEEAWAAGDDWDNPETPMRTDALSGTYCFYWNYTGYLEETGYLFQGPQTTMGGRSQSTLLVSDYFGYDYYQSSNAYGSCEKFTDAAPVKSTMQISGYWAGKNFPTSTKPEIKLTAGYVDGHVESYSSFDTATMRVIRNWKTGEPYPDGIGPGEFYLPLNALP